MMGEGSDGGFYPAQRFITNQLFTPAIGFADSVKHLGRTRGSIYLAPVMTAQTLADRFKCFASCCGGDGQCISKAGAVGKEAITPGDTAHGQTLCCDNGLLITNGDLGTGAADVDDEAISRDARQAIVDTVKNQLSLPRS